MDWLSKNHESLYDKSTQTLTYLEGKFDAFGISGTSAAWISTVVEPAQQTFAGAFLAWKNPATRTSILTSQLQEAEVVFKPLYRELYQFLKANPLVKNDDLLAMGFPERSAGGHTPVPVPATYPDLTIEPDGIRRVKVSFRDHDRTSVAKPHGVLGAVLRSGILPAPPVDVEDLTDTVLDTHSPYVFSFAEHQRGQTFYVVAAWQNTKGEKGDWSEIVNTVIP